MYNIFVFARYAQEFQILVMNHHKNYLKSFHSSNNVLIILQLCSGIYVVHRIYYIMINITPNKGVLFINVFQFLIINKTSLVKRNYVVLPPTTN